MSDGQENFPKCDSENGEYCASLSQRLQDQHSKGLVYMNIVNLKDHTTWGFAAYKESAKARGVVLNFCPFCGKPLYLPSMSAAPVKPS